MKKSNIYYHVVIQNSCDNRKNCFGKERVLSPSPRLTHCKIKHHVQIMCGVEIVACNDSHYSHFCFKGVSALECKPLLRFPMLSLGTCTQRRTNKHPQRWAGAAASGICLSTLRLLPDKYTPVYLDSSRSGHLEAACKTNSPWPV